jgi:pyridoxamine 5'-phosphate oxidase
VDPADLDPDPIAQFRAWRADARSAGIVEPGAMTLATTGADGRPSARMVLLRALDDRGFGFFTNLESRKGRELAANPAAALVFHWPELGRQVRVEGVTERIADEEARAYFASRPPGSRIGAWASPQSRPVGDRAELDALVRAVQERFGSADEIPLPPFWGGFRLVPDRIEFWLHGDDRLHDRAEYRRDGDGRWTRRRLAP